MVIGQNLLPWHWQSRGELTIWWAEWWQYHFNSLIFFPFSPPHFFSFFVHTLSPSLRLSSRLSFRSHLASNTIGSWGWWLSSDAPASPPPLLGSCMRASPHITTHHHASPHMVYRVLGGSLDSMPARHTLYQLRVLKSLSFLLNKPLFRFLDVSEWDYTCMRG